MFQLCYSNCNTTKHFFEQGNFAEGKEPVSPYLVNYKWLQVEKKFFF